MCLLFISIQAKLYYVELVTISPQYISGQLLKVVAVVESGELYLYTSVHVRESLISTNLISWSGLKDIYVSMFDASFLFGCLCSVCLLQVMTLLPEAEVFCSSLRQ